MGLCNMFAEGDTYVYEFHGHLNPKDWNVEVKDGRLWITGEEEWKTTKGDPSSTKFEWNTKLSRYCASTEFTLEPGDYFEGVYTTAPGMQNQKQHAGGKLRIVFPKV